MKTWGLILSVLMLCAACSTPRPSLPVGWPEDSYGGPSLPSPVDSDRADLGVNVIRGAFTPGRQPDGNTVILASRDGLIVFDAGRHRAHTQKILDDAKANGKPIIAIINSHWHLDHISGNILLREAYPGMAIYAHDASLTDALGGFLARGRESNLRMLADPATSPGLAEDLRGDIATVEQGALLHPTISIETSRQLVIGGRTLDVHVAKAGSAGDIWIYDAAEKLVATGDLITLPAPFLDTACPANWRAELAAILATPFETAIPGHGRAMTRADVTRYRDAFAALLDCAAGDAPVEACARSWAVAAAPLLDEASGSAADAESYARYYIGSVLRKPEARPAWCG